jgi:hypothetical protein
VAAASVQWWGWLLVQVKVVATVIPVHTMKVYREIWGAAPRVLNIGTIGGGQIQAAVALPQGKERLMTLNRGQGEPQGRTGRFGEKKVSFTGRKRATAMLLRCSLLDAVLVTGGGLRYLPTGAEDDSSVSFSITAVHTLYASCRRHPGYAGAKRHVA